MNIAQLLDNADLMVAAHHYENALATYNQIIEEKNDCDEAYLLRGELYGKLGKFENAFSDVLKAISIDSSYDESYMVLAALYLAQDNPGKALEAYQKAVALDNKKAVYKVVQLAQQLADQQLEKHQPDKAIENYRLAIKHAPDNTQLLYKHAFAVSRAGEFEHAIGLIEHILNHEPEHIPAKSLLIAIYEKTGQREKGWQQIQALVKAYPDNTHINIIFGKYALQNNKQTEAIGRLKHNLQKKTLKVEDQLSLYMLLGKLYDSISAYQDAFSYFTRANALKYNDYDTAEFKNQISDYINYFSKENYNKIISSNNDSSMPIFIVGMPRSGTSLVEQIVSSHSQVHGGGELQMVPDLLRLMESQGDGKFYPHMLSSLSGESLTFYAEELLKNMLSLSPGSQRITDKLPHNFLFVGLIHKLLPGARIINCLRDPVDSCLSCYFQHFGGYHPYAYNMTHLGDYYKQYARLMQHWEKELEIPLLNVKYENLVNNTKNEVENILNYLDLDWENRCLEFYDQKRAINTASYAQVNKNIYTDSIGRWKNYEPYIKDLITTLKGIE